MWESCILSFYLSAVTPGLKVWGSFMSAYLVMIISYHTWLATVRIPLVCLIVVIISYHNFKAYSVKRGVFLKLASGKRCLFKVSQRLGYIFHWRFVLREGFWRSCTIRIVHKWYRVPPHQGLYASPSLGKTRAILQKCPANAMLKWIEDHLGIFYSLYNFE